MVKNTKITPIRNAIAQLDKTGLMLQDGQHIACDTIILATGYEACLDHADTRLQNTLSYERNDRFQATLSGWGVHHADAPGYYQIGFYRGPYFGTMEMQARLATRHMVGDMVIDPQKWHTETAQEHTIRTQQPRPAFPRGDYVDFMMNMAVLLDAQPKDILEKAKSDEQHMIPADFRRFGIGAKPAIAEVQRTDLDAYTAPPIP